MKEKKIQLVKSKTFKKLLTKTPKVTVGSSIFKQQHPHNGGLLVCRLYVLKPELYSNFYRYE